MNHTCLILGHDFQKDWEIPYAPLYTEVLGWVYWHRSCHRCGEQQSKNCGTGEVTSGEGHAPTIMIIKYKGAL